MDFLFVEYLAYIFIALILSLGTLKVLKPSFAGTYLNGISNFANFDFKSTLNNIFSVVKLKNNKNDESIFTLI
jgi:hypothetical protein